MRRRGVNSLFNDFYLSSLHVEEGGRVSAPCDLNPQGGVLILACGGIMKRKIVFIESWSDYAPFGYRCRGGRWLMGTWALPIGQ